jgi:RNA recognition motif-containing protein
MAKKLYVGNLSYNTTKENLESLFGEFGTVQSVQVIMDRDTGRSKGFGFVEMTDSEAAEAAIKGLNGMQHDSRALTVNEARPQTSLGGGGGGGGGFGSSRGGGRRDRS